MEQKSRVNNCNLKNKMVVIVDDFAGEVAIEKFNNEMKTRSLDGTEVFVL